MLNKTRLENNLRNVFNEADKENADAARNSLATKLAQVIIDEVLQLQVSSVFVLATPPGGGTVAGTITNSVS